MENKIESKEEELRRRLQEEDNSSSNNGTSRATRWARATAVEIELEVLDCPICYLPLKPPVFQCAVGHVVCSCCCAKLAGKKCPTCGAAAGFSRCFVVEHIVESVRVPCANAGRGWCAVKTSYHGKKEHEKACPHAHAEVKAAMTGSAATDTPDVPEQGSRGQHLVAGLVLTGISILAVSIPVVRVIIKDLAYQVMAPASQR